MIEEALLKSHSDGIENMLILGNRGAMVLSQTGKQILDNILPSNLQQSNITIADLYLMNYVMYVTLMDVSIYKNSTYQEATPGLLLDVL